MRPDYNCENIQCKAGNAGYTVVERHGDASQRDRGLMEQQWAALALLTELFNA